MVRGGLYAPYDVDDGESRVVMPSAAFLAEQAADEGSSFFSRDHRGATLRGAIEDDAELRQADAGDRGAVVAKVVGKASSLLCVDGRVWARTVEPVIRFGRDRHRDGTRRPVHVATRPDERGARSCFRIDHGHRIVALMGLGDAVPELPFVEVLVREAVRLRVDERAMTESATAQAQGMSTRLKDASRAYFDAYATLRDAIPPAWDGLDDPHDDAPFHALARAMRSAWAVDSERFDGPIRDEGRQGTPVLEQERAVLRWEAGLDTEASLVMHI